MLLPMGRLARAQLSRGPSRNNRAVRRGWRVRRGRPSGAAAIGAMQTRLRPVELGRAALDERLDAVQDALEAELEVVQGALQIVLRAALDLVKRA